MKAIQYTGTHEIHVVEGGNWAPGDEREVPDDLAKRLLPRADFQTPKAKAPAKAETKAKAPAKATPNN